jgi:hypothetical protein
MASTGQARRSCPVRLSGGAAGVTRELAGVSCADSRPVSLAARCPRSLLLQLRRPARRCAAAKPAASACRTTSTPSRTPAPARRPWARRPRAAAIARSRARCRRRRAARAGWRRRPTRKPQASARRSRTSRRTSPGRWTGARRRAADQGRPRAVRRGLQGAVWEALRRARQAHPEGHAGRGQQHARGAREAERRHPGGTGAVEVVQEREDPRHRGRARQGRARHAGAADHQPDPRLGREEHRRGETPGKVGGIPYEALKKLRTLVGNEMADSGFASDVPRSKWKPLYAALSKDMAAAAQGAGPEGGSRVRAREQLPPLRHAAPHRRARPDPQEGRPGGRFQGRAVRYARGRLNDLRA